MLFINVMFDFKIILIVSLVLAYKRGYFGVNNFSFPNSIIVFQTSIKVTGDTMMDIDTVPWGPEFAHDVEMEFTPMDPRDFPEARNPDMHDDDVMILGSGNFEREIRRAYMIFIFFYKDKCEKCTKVCQSEGRLKC